MTMKSATDISLTARRRSLLWRVHFWAALIATPFALIAALTGILYIFTPQIEQHLYAQVDRVQPRGERLTLDDVVDVARTVMPHGATLSAVFPAWHAEDSVRVLFILPRHASAMSEHAMHGMQAAVAPPPWVADAIGTTVYVNPYSAQVLDTQAAGERFGAWSKKLHSSLLQGEGWRWMIELAASWLMVMLLTGIWLWWPRRLADGLPRRDADGRRWWSQWHAFFGIMLSLISVVMLTTGLTWSRYAGNEIRWMRDAAGQQSPQPPSGLRSAPLAHGVPMNWEQAADAARRQSPDIALRLIAPAMPDGTWRVMGDDPSRPLQRIDMVMDAYSGKPLFYADWKTQSAFAKATAVGIPFHRGEFGWWNQLLLLLFGAGVLFSLVSGWMMFFKRRRAGMPGWPSLLPGAWRAASWWMWIMTVLMCAAMPLLALTIPLVVAVEILLLSHRLRRA